MNRKMMTAEAGDRGEESKQKVKRKPRCSWIWDVKESPLNMHLGCACSLSTRANLAGDCLTSGAMGDSAEEKQPQVTGGKEHDPQSQACGLPLRCPQRFSKLSA
ncbi:small membrane A-kinase anchor protein isoform X3 [Anas acuta]|uniref:small membrane A-kinase anchor protein isoform X3 n=1 Tax=Anas acuta TaxID=28680 RepID=UPI0035C907A0